MIVCSNLVVLVDTTVVMRISSQKAESVKCFPLIYAYSS